MNIDGQLFQNNAEFVTSRWTEATTNIVDDNIKDIYRLSAVGINQADPQYTLHVNGDFNVDNGVFYLNQTKVFADSNGIIKINPQQINEDVDIPANNNAFSVGPIELIGTTNTITINSGAEWTIV